MPSPLPERLRVLPEMILGICRLLLVAWLRLEKEMQEEPGKEGQEQNRHNACGQIILLRGQYVVNAINAGQRTEDGEDKTDWLFS